MKTILVTGGAGYIGSFMTKLLCDNSYTVIVADSLEKGYKDSVDSRAVFEQGNLKDDKFLDELFLKHAFDAVIHFAGYISMAESMEQPGKYFDNNTFTTKLLLEKMVSRNVKNIIFSSTAGVYGNPVTVPIPEDHQKQPENPYGESKLMVEQLLHWYNIVHGVNFVALRYFNACGGALDGSLGEKHVPETHIIPNAIRAALNNSVFKLFGNDYDTPDGTAVRDYIHVLDLTQAHLLALSKLENSRGGFQYNVGTGIGHSNKEIVEMVKKVSGKDFQVSFEDRRKGDASQLIADPRKIKTDLGFEPKYSDLETIVATAWKWHFQSSKKSS